VKIYDVWADWCAPCKRFAPIFAKVATEFPDIDFEKVDADQNSTFLWNYGIQSIPTILIVDNQNKVIFQHAGILSEDNFRNLVSTVYAQNRK
jgi:thioredoxin 1